MKGVYFISGIDTDIGKTYATGYLAKIWQQQGIRLITQKLIQTGNTDQSEDIVRHRQIMGIPLLEEDVQGWTAPQIFSYPASPHLAARLDRKQVDLLAIQSATAELVQRYDVVLLEGAGGLMVPLTQEKLTIEYVAEQAYPVILVTSGRLGSINHTLLSLLALQHYGIVLEAIVFNAIHDSKDEIIAQDTRQFLQHRMKQSFPTAKWIELPAL